VAEEARLAALAAKEAEGAGEEEEKPKEEEEEPAEEEEGEEGEEKVKEEVVEVEKPKIRKRYKHLPFSEKDFAMRNPIDEYKIIKEVEDEVLNFKKENVKTYVISAGILYGKGEAIFNSHI
jgi:hypothetical protein